MLNDLEKQKTWAENLLKGFKEATNYIEENAKKAMQIAIELENYDKEEGIRILEKDLKEFKEDTQKILDIKNSSEIIQKLKLIVGSSKEMTSRNILYRLKKVNHISISLNNINIYL